jgi:glucokinase
VGKSESISTENRLQAKQIERIAISEVELPVLGLHIGATSFSASIVNPSGEIAAYHSERCGESRADQPYISFLDQCSDAVSEVLSQVRGIISSDNIGSCGVLVPVAVPEPRTHVGFAPALKHLKGHPLTTDVSDRIAAILGRTISVQLENDGNGMALAEWMYGSAKGLTDFIAIRFCTGVGCGIFTSGDLTRGKHGPAGEIGRQPFEPHGVKCPCGRFGCLETVASGRHLHALAESRTQRQFESDVDVVAAALNDEDSLRDDFQQVGSNLGRAISGYVNLMDPQRVILGGPVAEAYPLFEEALYSELFTFPETECRVVQSELEQCEPIAALAAVRYHNEVVQQRGRYHVT